MSPAAGGAAPTQPPPAAPSPPAAIAALEPDRAPPAQANRRDPAGQMEGADPGNAAGRKTAWNVPAPPPTVAAAAVPGGGVMGGGPGSWPALAESAAARVAPKSASSDSLKSLSDGSAPSASEDLIVPSLQPHPVADPISGGSNPTSSSPPPNATAVATSQQNGNADQANPVWHGGGTGATSGGGHSAGSNSSRDGNTSDSVDGNWNDGGLGGGSGSDSSYGHSSITNGAGVANMNNIIHSSGTSSSGHDGSRRASGNNNWNNNGRSGGSNHSAAGSGDGSNRNSSAGGNFWRNGSGSSNGFGGRGGNRNRRDHERGGSFSPRNYPRQPMPPQQQQPGIYQPGPFPRPPPPPPPPHFMMPQPFGPYVPQFAYTADVQGYPFYLPPVEQFQNMHLVRPPMQPIWVQQDQQNLQEDIRTQIEFYFSTNNLCHDTYLRRHMNDQGWVPIDLITQFNRMRRFTNLVDTNYILDAVRGSEQVEVQGTTVRRHNDWADWLLH